MTAKRASRGKKTSGKSPAKAKRAKARPRKPVHPKPARPTKPRAKAARTAKPRPAAPQASAVLHATDADFDVLVAASQTPVLVDLWAPWCGPCKALAPHLEEVARTLAGKVRVIKVNVDENPGLCERFNVRSIPLLMFLRGEERASLVGLQPAKELEAWVRARLAGEPAPEPEQEDDEEDSGKDEAIAALLQGSPPSVEELMTVLGKVADVKCTERNGRVVVHVPASGAHVTLPLADLRSFQVVKDPYGQTAVALLFNVDGKPREAVVAPHDFVFEPDPSDPGLHYFEDIEVGVKGMPPLVGYSEMMRDLTEAAPKLANDPDADGCFATIVMLHYFINGARRMGVDCGAALAAWEKLRSEFEKR